MFLLLAPNNQLLPNGLPLYDIHRLLQLGLLYGLTTALLGVFKFRADSLNAWYALPEPTRMGLYLFFGLGIVSAIISPSTGYALLEVALFFLLLCLTFATAAFFRHHPGVKGAQVITSVLAASLLLYLVPFTSGVIASRAEGVTLATGEFFHSFGNIRAFNDYLIWILPLAVLPGVLLPRRWHIIRALAWITAAGGWMLLIASASRGGILAFSVAIIVVVVAFRSQAIPWLRLQALVIPAGMLLYWAIFHFLVPTAPEEPLIIARSAHFFEDSERLMLWGVALDLVKTSPMLGSGPMHFAYYAEGMHASPHSAPVQIAAEWGLPAALLALGLMVWGMLAWIRGCRQKHISFTSEMRLVHVALTAAMIAGAVQSLVSGIIVSPISQVLMAVVVGWALACHSPQAPRRPSKSSINIIAAVCLVSAFSVSVWKPLVESPPLPPPEIRMGGEFHPPIFIPRFWRAGSIAPTPCAREPWLAECPRPATPAR